MTAPGPVAVAAVPTAPVLLPEVSLRQPDALAAPIATLRTTITRTLSGLPDVDTVVLLAAGQRTAVHLGARVDRTPSGHPQATADIRVDADTARGLGAALEAPVDDRRCLTGDLAVLAALVRAARPEVTQIPVTVAVDAAAPDLEAIAERLRVATGRRHTAVVAAGDLAATRELSSPGYVADGAVAFDETVAAALRTGEPTALLDLGAAEAARVRARGWAPLTVAALLATTPFVEVVLSAPCGVGQLVASTHPSAASPASGLSSVGSEGATTRLAP